jgi:hypothetical protein
LRAAHPEAVDGAAGAGKTINLRRLSAALVSDGKGSKTSAVGDFLARCAKEAPELMDWKLSFNPAAVDGANQAVFNAELSSQVLSCENGFCTIPFARASSNAVFPLSVGATGFERQDYTITLASLVEGAPIKLERYEERVLEIFATKGQEPAAGEILRIHFATQSDVDQQQGKTNEDGVFNYKYRRRPVALKIELNRGGEWVQVHRSEYGRKLPPRLRLSLPVEESLEPCGLPGELAERLAQMGVTPAFASEVSVHVDRRGAISEPVGLSIDASRRIRHYRMRARAGCRPGRVSLLADIIRQGI